MPTSRIEIEQLGPGRWVAEVEAGGTSAVRRHVTAPNFDEIVLAVVEAHAELTAPPAVKAPVLSVRELEAAQSERIQREVDAQAEAERDWPSASALPTARFTPSGPVDGDVAFSDKVPTVQARSVSEQSPPPVDAMKAVASRLALDAEAERLGIHVDRRWGTARLQEAIDAAKPNE